MIAYIKDVSDDVMPYNVVSENFLGKFSFFCIRKVVFMPQAKVYTPTMSRITLGNMGSSQVKAAPDDAASMLLTPEKRRMSHDIQLGYLESSGGGLVGKTIAVVQVVGLPRPW